VGGEHWRNRAELSKGHVPQPADCFKLRRQMKFPDDKLEQVEWAPETVEHTESITPLSFISPLVQAGSCHLSTSETSISNVSKGEPDQNCQPCPPELPLAFACPYQPLRVAGSNLGALLHPLKVIPSVLCVIFAFVGAQRMPSCHECREKPGLCAKVAGVFDWICAGCCSERHQLSEPGYAWMRKRARMEQLPDKSNRTTSGSEAAWNGTTLVLSPPDF